VDLVIGSFDFHTGTQGTIRRSEPIYSGSTAEASTPTNAMLTSSVGSTRKEHLAPMTRSNIGYATSLGDLADIFDGVSFRSSSNASSTRVLEHTNSKNIIDDDSADSGIRKVDSYPNFCTNEIYLAHHQVCVVDITKIQDGFVMDVK
jgi:hypothetical protein